MQSPKVKRSSVDVFVEGKAGKNAFPDAEALAKKYGVDADEERESYSKEDAESHQLIQQIEMARKQKALVQKLESKNVEVERLCALLEALEPVPGVDAAKYKRLMENSDGVNENVDFRDSKIVALAKKCRKLQMAVNKERSQNEAKDAEIELLRNTGDRFRKEIDSLSANAYGASSTSSAPSRTIRAGVSVSSGNPGPDFAELESTNNQLRRELASAHKTVEDLRRKLEKATDEAKGLAHALTREVGDGVTVEQAVDGGWRGRAQQIIMLKAKIKRLESGMGASTTATVQSMSTSRHSRVDVDAQAEMGLADMSSERKVAVDTIVEERARLMEECQKLESKAQGQKARIRKLEEESQTHRQQLKIVLEKSETDDQLIVGLRREIQRLKDLSQSNARKETSVVEARVSLAMRQSTTLAATTAEDELKRLRRQVANQADQLTTQATVIAELRKR